MSQNNVIMIPTPDQTDPFTTLLREGLGNG
jgi:hypothetical protein